MLLPPSFRLVQHVFTLFSNWVPHASCLQYSGPWLGTKFKLPMHVIEGSSCRCRYSLMAQQGCIVRPSAMLREYQPLQSKRLMVCSAATLHTDKLSCGCTLPNASDLTSMLQKRNPAAGSHVSNCPCCCSLFEHRFDLACVNCMYQWMV